MTDISRAMIASCFEFIKNGYGWFNPSFYIFILSIINDLTQIFFIDNIDTTTTVDKKVF